MDKDEIIQTLEELLDHWDPDEVVDFAYLSVEMITDILQQMTEE